MYENGLDLEIVLVLELVAEYFYHEFIYLLQIRQCYSALNNGNFPVASILYDNKEVTGPDFR